MALAVAHATHRCVTAAGSRQLIVSVAIPVVLRAVAVLIRQCGVRAARYLRLCPSA
jgi:hypothetical protein